MKNKIFKLIPLLMLIALEIISFFTYSLFQYPPSTESIVVSIAFIITFWVNSFIWSGNKKYLICISAYFFIVIVSFFLLLFFDATLSAIGADWLCNTILLIFISFAFPLSPSIDLICVGLAGGSNFVMYSSLIFIVISFYIVYFVGKYIKEKK